MVSDEWASSMQAESLTMVLAQNNTDIDGLVCTIYNGDKSYLQMWMNVPLTMVGVLTSVPTRMDPLCAAVELDSPWPVMD